MPAEFTCCWSFVPGLYQAARKHHDGVGGVPFLLRFLANESALPAHQPPARRASSRHRQLVLIRISRLGRSKAAALGGRLGLSKVDWELGFENLEFETVKPRQAPVKDTEELIRGTGGRWKARRAKWQAAQSTGGGTVDGGRQ
ncbi:Uu.00g128270.m01.CDS01 [Anthostomella pinea]|uniref:Uu.00g128270.m01.CDS01 n=1 Tax=Anthostomella pinea TaxID=933095 RepID=A0AAI8VIB3_9PEZI|nr:Uu.00g128270.m01.CDS01 [Anthostomella pinea]